nr:reverse transcriptase domain-containing protein [Tanacetum cinerariifolium]
YKEYLENSSNAIAPVLPTEEPEYSLSTGYEHLSTISETKSDEIIKSSAKNLVQIPSEYEVTSDDENDDDESLSNEDVPMENFKVYSNPLFDDGEINSNNIDPHYFNAESNLIEYLLNRDTLIDSSPKFDFLLKEFSGKLAHINPILPGIKEADFDLEEEIRLVENLLYDNSSSRPPEELNAEITDTIVESLSSSPISVEDNVEFFFDFEPDSGELIAAVINNIDELNEDDCFDPEGEINVFANIEDAITFPSYLSFEFFYHISFTLSLNHFVEIPSGEIKVHIEVLSVLWGNRLPIQTVRCRCLRELIAAVINNIDELNEDDCFDPEGEINVFANIKDAITFPSYLSFEFFYHISFTLSLNHFVEIPSGEIKVHIEVLSVLWGNRLSIQTVRCRCLGSSNQNLKFSPFKSLSELIQEERFHKSLGERPVVLTQSKLVPITAVSPITTVVPKTSVTRPRQAKIVVLKTNSPPRRHINHSPSPKDSNSPPRVTAVKAPMVNVAQVVLGKWEWKPKCLILNHVSRNTSASMTLKRFHYNDALGRSKHMKRNMSYLSDFEELNGGYVAFSGNPKGGKIFGKGAFSGNPKGGKISGKGKFDGKVDERFLVGYSVSSKAFRVFNSRTRIVQETLHNIDGDAAFDGRKPESEVNVSPSNSAQSQKHDDKTKRKAKGKSPVESLIGYRNLNKLDDALWAFRTALKTPIGCTPYKLVYGKSCHLPIELEHRAYWALKHVNFDLKTAGDHRKLQLNELNELRDQAYENSLIYKERTKKLHDSKIKNRIFNVGDQVLLFNSLLKIFSRKLKTRWSGPFTITQVFSYGTVELSQPNGLILRIYPAMIEDSRVWYGFSKNHKEMVKPRQDRTRDCEECTKAGSNDIFCALKSNHKYKSQDKSQLITRETDLAKSETSVVIREETSPGTYSVISQRSEVISLKRI